jgi:hypothetical protein
MAAQKRLTAKTVALPLWERELTARADGLVVSNRYASQRQPNSGEFCGGVSSGVQPVNFSIA